MKKIDRRNFWRKKNAERRPSWSGSDFFRKSYEDRQKSNKGDNRLKKGLNNHSKNIWKSSSSRKCAYKNREGREGNWWLEGVSIWVKLDLKMQRKLRSCKSLPNCSNLLNPFYPISRPDRTPEGKSISLIKIQPLSMDLKFPGHPKEPSINLYRI